MSTEVRKTGDFCWINILTSQPEEAKKFFAGLFGWTYGDLGGMGNSIKVDGNDIGGLFDLNSPQTPPGTPPVIGVMVKVDDADAIAAKAKALGGRSKDAFDIGENGRMAECFDPNGAEIDLWQPKREQATTADQSHHGAPSWYETYTPDVEAGKKFYTELFGWTAQTMPMPGMDYTVFHNGDKMIAGMMQPNAGMKDMPPHWATYFTVNDADETAKKAAELGGMVVVPPTDIPTVGRFSAIVSPQGVGFLVIKYLPRE
ncbi:MAG TPA: VOC family protein [Gemmatimonadaceae bacterium]|nr:VOC family protein [Gemmatimonadaceae bacterium]